MQMLFTWLICVPPSQAKDKITMDIFFIIATFTTPEAIGITPASILWILPLAASVSIVYKATKLTSITAADFIKETAASFAFGIILLILIAVGLFIFIRLFV